MNDMIRAVYRVQSEPSEVEKLARYITIEQTVEIPEELISADIRKNVVGKVESIRPVTPEPFNDAPSPPPACGRGRTRGSPSITGQSETFEVTIDYNPELCGAQLPQLLNLIYGNISLQRNIRLVDFHLPESFLRRFKGPNLGIAGIRRLAGVHERPLLATALKPNGAPVEHLAAYARDFALGGGDLIKDDQNLVDASTEAFRERVSRCRDAVEEANRATGRRTLYCPIVTAPHEEMEKRMEILVRLGVPGILIAPMLVGLDRVRQLSQKYGSLIFIAHPSLTGAFFNDPSHGIEPGLLLGKMFRLLGADASIFPNVGGRFSFMPQDCAGIRDHMRAPWKHLAPSLPMPAGGMKVENLPTLVQDYGEDAIFLLGGALLGHPNGVRKGTEHLLAEMRKKYEPTGKQTVDRF